MSEETSLLDEVIELLDSARQGTIAEADNIPDDRWGYRPHSNARSVSELVRHMIETAAMLVGEAADPEGDFRRRPPAEHVRAHAGALRDEMSPGELRAALQRTHEVNMRRVRDAGEAHMATGIRRFGDGTWCRTTYVIYAATHEAYHCGQLAIYARSMGLVPALTQRIHGGAAK